MTARTVFASAQGGVVGTELKQSEATSTERRHAHETMQRGGEEVVQGHAHPHSPPSGFEAENAKLLRRIQSLEVAVDTARGDAADAAQERDREHARASAILRGKTEAEAALDGMYRELARERAQAERAASEVAELREDARLEKARWQQGQHELSEANALIIDLQQEGEMMNETITRMQQLLDAERTRGTNASREQAGAALLAERERSRELEAELHVLRQNLAHPKPKPPPPSAPPPGRQAEQRLMAAQNRWVQQHQAVAVERGLARADEHVLRQALGGWRKMVLGRLHEQRAELQLEMQQLTDRHEQQMQMTARSQQELMQHQSELEAEVQRLHAEVQRLLHQHAQQAQMTQRAQQAQMIAERAAAAAAAEAAAVSALAVSARGPLSARSQTWEGGQRLGSETASWQSSAEGAASRQDWPGLRGMIDHALSSGDAALARQVWTRAESSEFTDAEIEECEGMLTELAEFIFGRERTSISTQQQVRRQNPEVQEHHEVSGDEMMMDDQRADDLGPISEGALSTEGSMSASEEDAASLDHVHQPDQDDDTMVLGLRDRIDQALGAERNLSVVNGLLEEAAAAKRRGQLAAACDSAVHGLRMYSLTLEHQEAEYVENHEGHTFEDLRDRIDSALGVERDPSVLRELLEEAAAAKRSGQLPPGCDAAVQGLQIYAMTLDDPQSPAFRQEAEATMRDSETSEGVTEVYEKLSREGEAALVSGQLDTVHELLRAADMLENLRPLPNEYTDVVRRLREYAASSDGGQKVVAWFAENGLEQYGQAAVAQGFDAVWVLRSLEDDGIRELQESVAMKPGHAQKLKFALKKLAAASLNAPSGQAKEAQDGEQVIALCNSL